MKLITQVLCSLGIAIGVSQGHLEGPIVTKACPSSDATASSTVSPNDSIQLSRGQCYGPCPIYTVSIQADGTVRWTGERFVATKGNDVSRIDPAKAIALIQRANKQGFNSLCEGYRRMVTDNPTYTTTLTIAGHSKSVSDYADAAPKWMQALEMEIDALADTYHWRRGDPAEQSFDGADLYLPKPGVTPTMKAAAAESPTQLQTLLKGGANPNTEDASGFTALMYAVGFAPVGNVKALLAAGATPNHQSKLGETPIMVAMMTQTYDPLAKIKLLRESGADINAQDKQGTTALMLAVGGGRNRSMLDAIPTLLQLGANPRLTDHDGKTALNILDREAKDANQTTSEDYRTAHTLLSR
jgi:hypothetical protein